MQIITRKDAKARGLKYYFTGKPCKYGHVADRRVDNSDCLICARKKQRRYYKKRAKIIGPAWYFTGKPCKRGHIAERYALTSDCRICMSERNKEWRIKNLLKVRRLDAIWREANREIVRESNQRARARYDIKHPYKLLNWQRSNPDKVKASKRRRRARRLGAEGTHSAGDIALLFQRQSGRCAYYAYCENDLANGYDVDHITPLARGGSNWPSNLQLCCDSCNSRKADRDPAEFVAALIKEKNKNGSTDRAKFRCCKCDGICGCRSDADIS
jgi:5-methylcytosine-specific restriction endonuclease McrA